MARYKREKFATIVGYFPDSSSPTSESYELLGLYTPDSSYEWNPDIQTTTDVLGKTHGDIEKSEPVQTFDPHYITKESSDVNDFDEYMFELVMTNKLEDINGKFNVYLVALFDDSGTSSSHVYTAYKHTGCTIVPTSIGGESYLGMPLEVRFSNKVTTGTCSTIDPDSFSFSQSA